MVKLHRFKLITLVVLSVLVVSNTVAALELDYTSPRLGVFSWKSENAAGPAGLMLDVEPYLTDAYKNKPDRSMNKYLDAMRKTYAYAQKYGVPLIIFIPYFYDTKGYTDILRALIEESSDAVAVMNYQKADESGQVETEMDLSKQAAKRLIHIFELQRPGLHDLTERNTYYLDGLEAVKDSIDKLYAHFDYEGLSFAIHDYNALREVIANE